MNKYNDHTLALKKNCNPFYVQVDWAFAQNEVEDSYKIPLASIEKASLG